MNRDNLIFLDTETTGMGPDGRLCQIAYKFKGEEFEALFKPPVPIEIEAMSVSHITNKMVEGEAPFIGSEMETHLKTILADGNILVAHNAQFDAEILRREGIEIGEIIDTIKIAQHLDKEAKVPKFSLQYLRYYFGLEVENVIAHNALGDIRVLEKLFDYLFEIMMKESGDEEKVLQEMIEISSRPVLVKRFAFGKYNGISVKEVVEKDQGYLSWLLGEKIKQRDQGGENDENWIYTLEHYLNRSTLDF